MRGHAVTRVSALATMGFLAAGLSACAHQPSPAPASGAATSTPQIVGLAQIDVNGAAVPADAGTTPANPAGDGNATCPHVSIATAGPLTGPDAALGINAEDGAELAVDAHNTANPGCQVTLKKFDTEGDPQKATQIAPQIINDTSAIGLVGPTFSGETKATGEVFDQAGLAAATPAATNATLSQNGWKTFFRGLANDDVQGPSVANYLRNTLGSKKVCVVDDSTDYGLGLAQSVRQTLGPVSDSSCNVEVKRGDKDFSAAVTQLKEAGPDAIFYSGYYTEAAAMVQQLRDAGVQATFASGDGSKDPEFAKLAGDAAMNSLLSCPCAPAAKDFSDEYTKKFGQAPGTYSTEAYDLATIMLKGIDSHHDTRPAMLDFIRTYQGQGVARKYQWQPNGELNETLIWMYKVQ
jgi:branched-chain amino acid transport system substrate-binding protein